MSRSNTTLPVDPARPLVVQVFGVADMTSAEKLRRQVPAWVVSGVVHVFFLAFMVLFFSSAPEKAQGDNEQILETTIAEAETPDADLTNPDLGFDADLAAATESPREEQENVEAPTMPDEPIGAQSETSELPTQTIAPPGIGAVSPDSFGAAGTDGPLAQGKGGANSPFLTAGMKGRSGATKDALIKAGGGNSESEAAVARGLIWLSQQQKSDGRWVFDGSSKNVVEGATGMALLPFLAAGQTHKHGKYIKNVDAGLKYLLSHQQADGRFGTDMYGHAIATIALCETVGMTMDPIVKKSAQLAINFCVKSQHSAGGWRYTPGTAGDTSVTGWFFQALNSGKLAGLTVPTDTMKRVGYFLDSMAIESGSQYGYSSKTGGHFSMNAVGLLCRQYAGWGPRNPAIANGANNLIANRLPTDNYWDMYYYYYATQVIHFYGGAEWHTKWNPKMRDLLIKRQVKLAGPEKGSWEEDNTITGSAGGRLGTTCLALLTLEVYYRHLPLYKRDTGGLAELEK